MALPAVLGERVLRDAEQFADLFGGQEAVHAALTIVRKSPTIGLIRYNHGNRQ